MSLHFLITNLEEMLSKFKSEQHYADLLTNIKVENRHQYDRLNIA